MKIIQKSGHAVVSALIVLLTGCTSPPEADEPDSRSTRKQEPPANGQNRIYWIKDRQLCDELDGKIDDGDGICRL